MRELTCGGEKSADAVRVEAVSRVSHENVQRDRLHQMERSTVRMLEREKTP